MARIVLTGGSGLLGRELKKIDSSIFTPTHSELDITNLDNIIYDCKGLYYPDMIIHSAALLDDKIINKHPDKVIETNIIGTANIAITCIKLNIRMIYISTDYVYKGDKGYYKEEDELLPFNLYSWSKLGGEASTKGVRDHLIIRTSFGPSKFPYSHAFSDVWRSKDYVQNVAKDIYKAAISPLQGTINIGGPRRTVYEYAKEQNPDILPIKQVHSDFTVPKDTSLNLTKWKNYKNGNL